MRRLSDCVVELTLEGHLTEAALAAAYVEYWRVVGENALPYAVLDGTGVTGFDRAMAESASAGLRVFRSRGGREYLVVTTSSALRMIAAATAASSGVPFRFFDTRAEAFEHLRSIGVW